MFKITPTGTLTTLHHFVRTDGWQPYAALVRAIDGNLYGTTVLGWPAYVTGGAVGWGTQPASGEVGAAVKILGNDLTGASSVTFNGTPAAITFVSPSEISTAVPSGATTGKVAVTTDGMTLLSNVPFRVLP